MPPNLCYCCEEPHNYHWANESLMLGVLIVSEQLDAIFLFHTVSKKVKSPHSSQSVSFELTDPEPRLKRKNLLS